MQNSGFIFGCAAFIVLPREAKSGFKKESWVGEPLKKLWLFASVSVTDATSTK